MPPSGLDTEQCVADAIEICQIAAPTGDEHQRARWLRDLLNAAGWPAEIDSAGNVSGSFGDGPALVVAAHLDTVFPAGTDLQVRRDGDILRAPGIGDNSMGVAGLLTLARSITTIPEGRRLVLAGTVGEEGLGNIAGAKHLVSTCPQLREFIALEGSMIKQCVTQGIGSLRARLTISGPGGHSWADRGAPSATHTLVRVLDQLTRTSPTASTNISQLQSAGSVNTISPCASAVIEFRDQDTGALREALTALRSLGNPREGVTFEIEILGERPGGMTDAAHPLVRDALLAREHAGLDMPALTASSTDANAALGQGVAAITIGIAHGERAHSHEEWLDVALLGPGLAAARDLILRRLSSS